MIYFDTTKTGRPGRRSGLDRVSSRLREALGARARSVIWDEGARDPETWDHLALQRDDVFLSSELFSEDERPGFTQFLAERPCRLSAIFHDAIPLKHPHITWPRSVARHPGYMKLLASFDRVWAVSAASRTELLGFWNWQGVEAPPPVSVIPLGADFNARPRVTQRAEPAPRLLCVGIIEPRKNQAFLLEVCRRLWTEGLDFELHIVGRVNPHFGAPIVAQIKSARRAHRRHLHYHAAATDTQLAQLFATARALVFPTIAEGCGLPLLESLWMGVPCVCSDLPVLRENADGGGCLAVPLNDPEAWASELRRMLTDDGLYRRLSAEACTRPLPTWRAAAEEIAGELD
jgi:glycosyltransferase involved in cell wall biosynthesis